MERELDQAVADHALLGDDLGELGAGPEQARVRDRDLGPCPDRLLGHRGDHGVTERRAGRGLQRLVVALGRLARRRERHRLHHRAGLHGARGPPARLGPDLRGLPAAPRDDEQGHHGEAAHHQKLTCGPTRRSGRLAAQVRQGDGARTATRPSTASS